MALTSPMISATSPEGAALEELEELEDGAALEELEELEDGAALEELEELRNCATSSSHPRELEVLEVPVPVAVPCLLLLAASTAAVAPPRA